MVALTGDWRQDLALPDLITTADIGLIAHPDQRDAALAEMDRLIAAGHSVQLTLTDAWEGSIARVYRNKPHVELAA